MLQLRSPIAAIILFLPLLAACTTVVNPATGKKEYSAITPEQEKQIGRSEHPKLLAQFGGAYDNADLGFYVSRLGAKLAAHSELPANHFTFTLVDSPIVNAFALPGGYVYVTRGVVALANSEAELAGVLAHEIGHVTARHTAQRITNAQRGQAMSLGLSILGSMAGIRGVGEIGNQLTALTLQSWSRDQEFEADRLGIRYMIRAGYDPRGMARFLAAMQRQQKLDAELAGRPDAASAWNLMSTHPRTSDRVMRAVRAVEAKQGKLPTRDNRDFYLDEIDGMTWADSAKQGFARDGVFTHPGMGFTFTLPPGWQMQNQPSAVLGNNQAGHIFKFDIVGSGGKAPADLLRQWTNTRHPAGLRTGRTELGRWAIARAGINLRNKRGVAMVMVVTDDRNRAWRMMFARKGAMSANDRRDWNDSFESLRALEDWERDEFRPQFLASTVLRDQRHLSRILRRMPNDAGGEERLRIINGIDPGALIPNGYRLKIIEE